MCNWYPIKSGWLYGIAKSHYSQDAPHRLTLTTGDAIIIKGETENWYFGYKKDDRHQQGIFPKSYVVIVDAIRSSDGWKIRRSPIVEEITTILIEWQSHLLTYYLSDKQKFMKIQEKMLNLIKLRQQLLSGNLPTDEFRELKLKATEQIDTGNNMLSLDMVVRDDAGNIIDFGLISTTQLYELHCKAVERIKQSTTNGANGGTSTTARNRSSKNYQSISHNFLVTLNSVQCKFVDDMELLFTLYAMESKEGNQTPQIYQLTENYFVPWMKGDTYKDKKMLFTDLSTEDMNRSKIFLVAFMVRMGPMEARDPDAQPPKGLKGLFEAPRRESSTSTQSLVIDQLRRPFGVAILDLTPIKDNPHTFNDCAEMSIHTNEKECLESFLKRCLLNRDQLSSDGRTISVSVEKVDGDIKQIKDDYSHIERNLTFARKMGFPEVILPGDVRNDLYLTLMGADLGKSLKSLWTDNNIEICVSVCTDKGEIVPNSISKGGGASLENEYKSVIYTKDDRPKWNETIKIVLPIENFKHCHVKFLFKNRHSQEAKDKANKPFALAHVKLMDADETAIQQGEHSLAVYKIDKKADIGSMLHNYIDLPTENSQANALPEKPSAPGFAFMPKDSFIVKTNLCSTRLTQDAQLLSLLNWQSNPSQLVHSLENLLQVQPSEMVKFYQDILDTLFNIFCEYPEHEKLVFKCIIRLIDIVSNPKYRLFESVLDVYIKEGFSATLAYRKLIEIVRLKIFETVHYSEDATDNDLYSVLKYLQYIMKFTIQSRILFMNVAQLNDQAEFDSLIEGLLLAFNQLISKQGKVLLKSKGAVLKYLHVVASDLIKVYDPIKLSHKVEGIINSIPQGDLGQSKMIAIKDLVESQLFRLPQCRFILLPVFCKQIVERLEGNEENDVRVDLPTALVKQANTKKKLEDFFGHVDVPVESNRQSDVSNKMQECINILNNVLKNLSRTDIGSVEHDIKTIMTSLLRTIIQSVIALSDQHPLKGNLVAVMLGIFHHMRSDHYRIYVQNLPSKLDKKDFLTEILIVFATLVQKPVFPPDWMDMIMHQNTVILESLRHFSVIIMEHFYTKSYENEVTFEKEVWSKFFFCATNFLVQPSLQIDQFSSNKKSIIIKRYRDIRRETAVEVRRMWFNLGEYKIHFIPELVGSILEMSMLPDDEIRKATIPIFPDMMISEFLSSRFVNDSFGDTKRNPNHCKGNFSEFETEMIKKLDILIKMGHGDEAYRQIFDRMMTTTCKQGVNLKDEGVAFVKKATALMGKLLEYRKVVNDQSLDNLMACTVQLLNFYAEYKHCDMYVMYLNRLYKLHMKCDNYTEAAYTLKKFTGLLKWDETKLSNYLKCELTEEYQVITHRELKEQLYQLIIHLFDKGKMWETALDVCKELVNEFETKTFNYHGLSKLHERMSKFYLKILNEYKDSGNQLAFVRAPCEYYRVGFYGQSFPEFLRNKQFIYRAGECEKLESFTTRLQSQHPQAELLKILEVPGRDIQDAKVQYIQAVGVKPIPSDKFKNLQEKLINTNISGFYEANDVEKFELNRPYYAEGFAKDDVAGLWVEQTVMETETPLPCILKSALIVKTTVTQVSPIENAMQVMDKTNKSLKDMIIKYSVNPNLNIQELSMKLSGVVEAAVQGGLKVYEDAFLTEEYMAKNPRDYTFVQKLKDLIANQMPLLQSLIAIHKERMPSDMLGFHQNIEMKFNSMKDEIERKYGTRTADIDHIVVLRKSLGVQNFNANRQSDTSTGSQEDKSSRKTSIAFFLPGTSTARRNKKKELEKQKKQSRETIFHVPVTDYSDDTRSIQTNPDNYSLNSSNAATTPNKTSSQRIELTEHLVPSRPLRPDNRGTSRPPSILTNGSCPSMDSNINEETETDSIPPPVPPKNRDSDYFGSTDGTSNRSSGESTEMASLHSTSTLESKEPIYSPVYKSNRAYEQITLNRKVQESDHYSVNVTSTKKVEEYYITDLKSIIAGTPVEEKRPPTPPPKPSRSNKSTPTKNPKDVENNNIE